MLLELGYAGCQRTVNSLSGLIPVGVGVTGQFFKNTVEAAMPLVLLSEQGTTRNIMSLTSLISSNVDSITSGASIGDLNKSTMVLNSALACGTLAATNKT